MDVICPRCTEPWDIDGFHELVRDDYREDITSFDQAYDRFKKEGCGVFEITCEKRESKRALASSVIMEMMGDDVDGAASTLEDFEFLGMLDE